MSNEAPSVRRARKQRALAAALALNRGELEAEKLRRVLRLLAADEPPTQPRTA